MAAIKTYLVGGAVRDALLGLPVADRDWVVVGATQGEMLSRGFVQVGRDFPVFLHPESGEEYALARTERKTAAGHTGFEVFAEPSVTLEEDLVRRDLTINAIAQTESGDLVDPHGGARDLADRVLRHVSDAFEEDPLRVFRVARFAARFDFSVAPETLALMRRMAQRGDLRELAAERVWQEFFKSLSAPLPNRFVEVLADAAALSPWFDELEPPVRVRELLVEAHLRFGSLGLLATAAALDRLSGRLKAPKDFARLAQIIARHGSLFGSWRMQPADAVLHALHEAGLLRRQSNFSDVSTILSAQYPPSELDKLAELVVVLQSVGAHSVPADLEGAAIGIAIAEVRTELVRAAQNG